MPWKAFHKRISINMVETTHTILCQFRHIPHSWRPPFLARHYSRISEILKIQSETKFSLRQNPVRDKVQTEKKKSEKNIFLLEKFFFKTKLSEKNWSRMLSQISSAQSELSQTNRWLSSLSGIYIPQ